MREIPRVLDPHDQTGSRCEAESSGIVCRRRKNHPPMTQVALPKEDPEDADVVVTFNHRGTAGGKDYTW